MNPPTDHCDGSKREYYVRVNVAGVFGQGHEALVQSLGGGRVGELGGAVLCRAHPQQLHLMAVTHVHAEHIALLKHNACTSAICTCIVAIVRLNVMHTGHEIWQLQ
jgi:hypothetical protein